MTGEILFPSRVMTIDGMFSCSGPGVTIASFIPNSPDKIKQRRNFRGRFACRASANLIFLCSYNDTSVNTLKQRIEIRVRVARPAYASTDLRHVGLQSGMRHLSECLSSSPLRKLSNASEMVMSFTLTFNHDLHRRDIRRKSTLKSCSY